MACRDVEQANVAASHIRAEVDAQVRKSARVAHDSDWEHGVDYVATGTVEVRLFSHRRLFLLLPPILLRLAPPLPLLAPPPRGVFIGRLACRSCTAT